MRNSKVLKILCYIFIPIFVLIILIASLYEILKYDYVNALQNNPSEYFKSEEFLCKYMSILACRTEDLIFRNDSYKTVQDGEFKICYQEIEDDGYYYNNIKNNYYLIIYKNIALTNIELSIETDTIDEIKEYIQKCDGKKVTIENGEVNSTTEIIKSKGIQYFELFENTYYTIESGNEITTYDEKSKDIEEVNIYSTNTTNSLKVQTTKKEFYDVTIKDFLIYSTYSEELEEEPGYAIYKNILNDFAKYEDQLLVAIPVCSAIILIMIIYLIISIGHVKGKEGIDINDFDKIPLEIVLFAFFLILVIPIVIIDSIFSIKNLYDARIIYSLIITAYIIFYIDCVLLCITIIKRIKAKILIKESLCARFIKWIFKILKKIFNKIKDIYIELTSSLDITLKLCIGLIIFIIMSVFLIVAFNGFGFILSIAIVGVILYELIKSINCYKKIEEHLKLMYEGNHSQKLNSKDFMPQFQEIIKYINDISNGFENAIQDGIKSERMKTELITNVSHDIKTPLTSIINYVDLLKKEKIENEKAKEYITILDNKSQRLKKLTEDLVEASKASSGSVKLNIERIDITELIKQSIGEFEDKFKDKKLEIISNIPEEKLYINVDNRYMYRVVENLFSNISKYALENSRVYIDIKKEDKKIKIAIKNISKERLNISADELMQRFVRGDKSRTTEGSGLGISISKSLTELQKGKFNLSVDGDLFKVELEFNLE